MRPWKMEVGGHRKIRRPKLKWRDGRPIRKVMKDKLVQSEETQYRRIIDNENSKQTPNMERPKKKF